MPAENLCACLGVCLPGLASDKNLAGVHDTAGQARSVDGAQSRAELNDVGPDQGLREQTRMLPWWGRFMLPCAQRHASSHKCNMQGLILSLNFKFNLYPLAQLEITSAVIMM